jgi:hypothetical protein
MKKDRQELEANVISVLEKVKLLPAKDRKAVETKVKKGLKDTIDPGSAMNLINHAERELLNLDTRILCVFTEQLYIATGDLTIKVDDYFSPNEIKKAKTFNPKDELEDTIELPITLDNVLMIDSENYMTMLDIKTIKKIFHLLRYNFDTQREAKIVRRQGSIEKEAKLNMTSVKEISERLLNGTLSPTTITFNLLAGTSDFGNEGVYDSKKMQLQITSGTFIDILDGFHRLSGTMNALDVNPELDFKFQIAIKNYNLNQAQKHLAEISKVNVISKIHIEALEASRYSDTVVKQLQRESDLKGRISQTERVITINNELVSYNVLADTIEEEFKMETKKDAMEVGDYLTKFFDYLIGTYQDEFINNLSEIRNKSIIAQNNTFAGYVVLARRMKEEGIKITQLENILSKIDFSRENKFWDELNILDEGRITNKTRKKIKEFFEQLDLREGVSK